MTLVKLKVKECTQYNTYITTGHKTDATHKRLQILYTPNEINKKLCNMVNVISTCNNDFL